MRKPRTRKEKRDLAAAELARKLQPKQYLVDLFGEKRPIPVKVEPQRDKAQLKARQESERDLNYAMVGAPVNRHIEEKGNIDYGHCGWCHNPKVAVGFSLCFAHFCICPECVERGLDEFSKPGPMMHEECFKCTTDKRKVLPKEERRTTDMRVPVYVGTLYPEDAARTYYHYDANYADKTKPTTSFEICRDCLGWAQDVLTNRLLNRPSERDGRLTVSRGKQDPGKTLLLNL